MAKQFMSIAQTLAQLKSLAAGHGFFPMPGRSAHWIRGDRNIIAHFQFIKAKNFKGLIYLDAAFDVSAKLDPADNMPPPIVAARRELGTS